VYAIINNLKLLNKINVRIIELR